MTKNGKAEGDNIIRVRANEEQVKLMEEAAKRDGLGVSSWLRMLGLKEARVQDVGRLELIGSAGEK